MGPLYVDIHAAGGFGKAEIEDEAKSPEVNQYSAGATLGFKMRMIYLGVSADYYKVDQTTEPDANFGDRGGVRTNIISPTIGLNFRLLKLKFDYQMQGTYKLDKEISGEKVSFKDPTGYRIYAGVPMTMFTEIGAFYESVTYKTEINGSSETSMDKKLNISQMGLMIVFRL